MPSHGIGTRPRTGAEGRALGPSEQAAPPPWLYDPRPDLTADTRVWQALLELAFLLDGEAPDGLFGALHGVRCCGARLVPSDGTGLSAPGYRMAPGDDYLGGARAWDTDRQRWLVPAADVLTPVLRGLRAVVARHAPGDETTTGVASERGSGGAHRTPGGRS